MTALDLACSATATRGAESSGPADSIVAVLVDVATVSNDTSADSATPDTSSTDETLAALDIAPEDLAGPDTPSDVDADLVPDTVAEPDLPFTEPDADAASEPDAPTELDALADADTAQGSEVSPDAVTVTVEPLSVAEVEALLESTDAAGVAALVADWDGPVCDASGCVIVSTAKSGVAVTALGGFNDWSDQSALTLKQSVADADTYWATLEPPPSTPTPYKLKHDGEWTLDPSNPYVLFGGFGFDSALTPPGYGRITVVPDVASPQLSNSRDLFVYLPAAYFTDLDARFPVLYLNDGKNVFQNPKAPFGSWDVEVTADALNAAAQTAPVIFVGVDTNDRMAEYSYAPIDLGDGPIPPKGALYADFLADTVRPVVDGQFRTRTETSVTGIAGSSLGGIISMYVAWVRPDAFGRVGSFSGAYWVGEEAAGEPVGPSMRGLIEENEGAVPPGSLRVYIDSGDTTSGGGVGYASDSWAYSDWTRNALIGQGWDNRAEWDTDGVLATAPTNLPESTDPSDVPHVSWTEPPPSGTWLGASKNLLSVVGHGHQHNESAWKQRFAVALRFLYPSGE